MTIPANNSNKVKNNDVRASSPSSPKPSMGSYSVKSGNDKASPRVSADHGGGKNTQDVHDNKLLGRYLETLTQDDLSNVELDESLNVILPENQRDPKELSFSDFNLDLEPAAQPMKPGLLSRAIQGMRQFLQKNPSHVNFEASMGMDSPSIIEPDFDLIYDETTNSYGDAGSSNRFMDLLTGLSLDELSSSEREELEVAAANTSLEELEKFLYSVIDDAIETNLDESKRNKIGSAISSDKAGTIKLSMARRIIYSLLIRLGMQGIFLRKLLDRKELSSSELNQVKYLMNAMSFEDIKAIKDNAGRTILHSIARNGHAEALDALIERFGKEDGFVEFISMRENSPLGDGINLSQYAQNVESILMETSRESSLRIGELVLLRESGNAGPTPFDVAIIRGHTHIAVRLYQLGAKRDTLFLIQDSASGNYFNCTTEDAALMRLENLKKSDSSLAKTYEEETLGFLRGF